MAEELAFEQGFRDRGAVDRHEIAFASAEFVQGARHKFLAGPAFALDQHAGTCRRDLADRVHDLPDGGRIAEDMRDHAAGLVELAFEFGVFGFDVARLQRALDAEFKLVDVHRFRDEVERAEFHGLDGGVDRAVGGEEDARRRVGKRKRLFQHPPAPGMRMSVRTRS